MPKLNIERWRGGIDEKLKNIELDIHDMKSFQEEVRGFQTQIIDEIHQITINFAKEKIKLSVVIGITVFALTTFGHFIVPLLL